MQTVILIIFLIVVCFATGIYPIWKDNIIIYVILMVSFASLLYFLVFTKVDIVEHLQISSEAVQNVGSIFNSNKMIIKDLELTGDLTLPNKWKVSTADSNCKFYRDGALKATIDTNGNLLVGGDTLKIKTWSIKDMNTEMQFLKDGVNGNTHAFMSNGNLWSQGMNSYRDVINEIRDNYVKYGQNLSIHGNSGILDNYGNRCNKGDRDRDIGISCQQGIGQSSLKWQLKKS